VQKKWLWTLMGIYSTPLTSPKLFLSGMLIKKNFLRKSNSVKVTYLILTSLKKRMENLLFTI